MAAYLEMDPDVILLNSTGVRDGDPIIIPGYSVHQNNLSDGQPSSGSAVAIKSSVAFNKVCTSREGIQIIELKLEQYKLCIITFYIPPREPDGELLLVKVSTFYDAMIYLQDINTKHWRL